MTKSKLARQTPLKAELWPIAQLLEDPKNSRRHSDRNLKAIEKSLKKFGQVEPLLVDKKTNIVIGGNGRLAVMRRLGWAEANVIPLDITDTEAAALSIVLNRSSELATWDFEQLAETMRDLDQNLWEVSGWTAAEIETFLGSVVQTVQDIDRAAEWEGMPSFEHEAVFYRQILVNFTGPEGVKEFATRLGVELSPKTKAIRFPVGDRKDRKSEAYAESSS